MTTFNVGVHGLLEKDGRYLVLRRLETDSYMPGKWDLPGGSVEAGEKVEEALLREIMEESGVTAAMEKPIYIYSGLAQLPARQNVTIIYACTWVSGDVQLSEHSEYKWATKEEIAELDCIHFLRALL